MVSCLKFKSVRRPLSVADSAVFYPLSSRCDAIQHGDSDIPLIKGGTKGGIFFAGKILIITLQFVAIIAFL